MRFDHASKPFSATIAAFGSIVSAGLVSTKPLGSNQRKNRLVVRCMFSCGIEPK